MVSPLGRNWICCFRFWLFYGIGWQRVEYVLSNSCWLMGNNLWIVVDCSKEKYMKITKETIIELEYKLIEAIKTSDLDFLGFTLHDDLLFQAPNGQIITKEIDLAFHKSGQMFVESIIPTYENVNIINNVAIVTVVYKTKGTMFGNPIDGDFRDIRFWKQFTEGIKIIGGSCHSIA